MSRADVWALRISIATVGLLMAGCAWLAAKAPVLTVDVANEVACIVGHDTEPPLQIVSDCAGVTIEDVTNLLAARKAYKAAHATP